MPDLVRRLRGSAIRDLTLPLSKRARRCQNKARFKAQPKLPPRMVSTRGDEIVVHVGKITGVLQGAEWVSILASLNELVSAARNGRLRYTLPGREPTFAAEPGELFVQLPSAIDGPRVQIGPLAGVRIVYDHVNDDRVAEYRQRAPRPSSHFLASSISPRSTRIIRRSATLTKLPSRHGCSGRTCEDTRRRTSRAGAAALLTTGGR